MDYNDFVEKHKKNMISSPVFDESYIIGNITYDKKIKMKEMLNDGIGYIV